jgi:hypothetical protein
LGRLAAKRLLARRRALVLLLSLVLAVVPAPLAGADPTTVCASGCDYQTIQEAIDNAVAGDSILVKDPAHTEAGISVTEDVTIRGQGAPNTIVQAAATKDAALDRVFLIESGATATIEDMTIRHGYGKANETDSAAVVDTPDSGPAVATAVASATASALGGGIYVAEGGALTVNRCTVTDNQVEATAIAEASALAVSKSIDADIDAEASALADASADANGGGIANSGTLTVTQTTVNGNLASATADAKAHASASGPLGAYVIQTPVATATVEAVGGIYNAGAMTVVNSTVSGNEGSADSDALADNESPSGNGLADMRGHGAGSRGPDAEAPGRSVIGRGDYWTRTELTCDAEGGCVELKDQAWQTDGPGVARVAPRAPADADETTAMANATGGIYNEANPAGQHHSNTPNALGAAVRYSTVFDNGGSAAATALSVLSSSAQELAIGGIQNRGALELESSIVALQRSGPDCGGDSPITSLGTSLDSDDTCNLNPALGDLPDTDPLLGTLQDNGGPTETHALSPTSPALDQIGAGSKGCGTQVSTDQRDVSRPQGAKCDVGAYEAGYLTLTVARTGNGSGSVTGSGVSCGSDCTEVFVETTVVTLTAGADTGSAFSGWSGACKNTTGDCVVAMTEAKTVTATFTLNTYPLTVSLAGDGSGTVSSQPAGVDCPIGACQASFDYGAAVTLTAVATISSTFGGWSGDCSAAGDCTVTMTETRSVTATFALVADTEYAIYLPFITRMSP